MKLTTINAAAVALALVATPGMTPAQTNTYDFDFPVGVAVPDGNPSGRINQQIVSGTAGIIADLNVTLSLSVACNADLYAYLTYAGQISVLLNRVGVTSTNSFGYSAPGLNITLDDQAANNVHLYEEFSPAYDVTDQLLGVWQPDGRDVDPDLVNESVSPTALLNRFNGLPANGTWTLFVADLSSDGEPTTLASWGLRITTTVPEPGSLSIAAVGALLLWSVKSAQRRRGLRASGC